jgi:glycosyltransferase involved in cell wall biosynthesis
MSTKVQISVVIPAYNSAAFIAKTLESVLAQTLQPAEVIVVDDGSTDETLKIVQGFGDTVRCISQRNMGVSAARNAGIESARYEWIALLDSDDLWRADKLERQAGVILEDPAVDFIYTGHYCFFEDRIESTVPAQPASRIKQSMYHVRFMTSSVVLRRSKAIEIGGFDTTLRSSEDWDLWLRLVKDGARFAAIDEPLTSYRKSPSGLTHQPVGLFECQRVVIRRHIASDASAISRWWTHTRLISRLEGEAAIVMRDTGSKDHLTYMLRSLCRFPFLLSAADKRHKIALHMLLTKLGILRAHAGH